MTVRLLPGEESKEEITGELVEYLRAKGGKGRLRSVYLIHYAYDRRDRTHEHNPWVLAWYDHDGHQLPAKMPLWVYERLAERSLAWEVVPPAQGQLF